MIEAMDGLRDLGTPPGSARVGRCLGRASGEGPGGDVAEYGGDAMAMLTLLYALRWKLSHVDGLEDV